MPNRKSRDDHPGGLAAAGHQRRQHLPHLRLLQRVARPLCTTPQIRKGYTGDADQKPMHILRGGLTIEALKQHMVSQGPSPATIMLEWDRIWVLKKIRRHHSVREERHGQEAEFIKIPDGEAASLASKAAGAGGAVPPESVDVVPKTKGGARTGGWGKSGPPSAAKSPTNILTPTKESAPKLGTKSDVDNGRWRRAIESIPISTQTSDNKPVVGDAQSNPSSESTMYHVKSVYKA
ncbi:hypothetical protein FRC00_002979 [Tulasnella sp. 408]|nr:hypothetical protein FRC00_002979 [Tulasnella sp. 408]